MGQYPGGGPAHVQHVRSWTADGRRRKGRHHQSRGQRRAPGRDRRSRGRRHRAHPPGAAAGPAAGAVHAGPDNAINNVERGAQDSDWQPLKDAAKKIAYAEDRAIFEGYPAAGIQGIRAATSNAALALPADPHDYPDVVIDALTALRLAGVNGPYSLALSTKAYDAISVTSDHGYPIRRQIEQLFDGDIRWAPAIDGAFLLSARGGDYTLSLGQDLAIGYLSHDAASVQLYFQESLTFLVYTTEAIVAINPQP